MESIVYDYCVPDKYFFVTAANKKNKESEAGVIGNIDVTPHLMVFDWAGNKVLELVLKEKYVCNFYSDNNHKLYVTKNNEWYKIDLSKYLK